MAGNRSRYELLAAALGAVLLALAVFLPWYGVSFTASGLALAQQFGEQAASQYGNAALQGQVSGLHASIAGLVGHEFTALSAHQALKYVNVLLLVLAGLALLDALVPLARSTERLPDGAGGSVAVLGGVATLCVIYRMLVPPAPAGTVLALTVREGAWLALVGSLTMLVAGIWRNVPGRSRASQAQLETSWSRLSGWTPDA